MAMKNMADTEKNGNKVSSNKKVLAVTGIVVAVLILSGILFYSLKGPVAGRAFGQGFGAATVLTNCADITSPGVYEIRDIDPARMVGSQRESCFLITSDDVTLRCTDPNLPGPGFDINNLRVAEVITAIEVNNVQAEAGRGILITGCEVSNFVNGLIVRNSVGGSSGIVINRNVFDNVFTGINLVGSDNVIVDSNQVNPVSAAGTFGLAVSGGSTENVISRNTIVGAERGIAIFSGLNGNNHFIRNTVRGSTVAGLEDLNTGERNFFLENNIGERGFTCSESPVGIRSCVENQACSGDNQCIPSKLCDNQGICSNRVRGDVCTVACGSPGLECRNNLCLLGADSVPITGQCADESECRDNLECVFSGSGFGTCQDINQPVALGHGDSCTANDNCGAGRSCRNGQCLFSAGTVGRSSACAQNSECASGLECPLTSGRLSVCTEIPREVIRLGDVNDDTFIDAIDSLLIKRFEVGFILLTAEQQQRANVNSCQGDTSIDAVDALLIERLEVGLITSLPCS